MIDELGLLQERDRPLINGLRSSTSARNGRLIALTIHGDGPFVPEFLEAADDPAVCVHHYAAAEDCDLQDEAAWHAANPGLAASIKSMAYMRDRARLAARRPQDAADFRGHDLNLPGAPSREMICAPQDWLQCVVPEGADGPERTGPVVVGLDAGGSASMTAAVAIWSASGRCEAWGAFPANPDLLERGKWDGVGGRYALLHASGELLVYPGRSTPVVAFLRDVADDLQGEQVIACGADRYRQSDVQDALSDARLRWPIIWRGQGASATADGSADVLAAQRMILDQTFGLVRGRGLMVNAIAESAIRRDGAGNPALEKGRSRGRIDPLSAFVIAAGLAERHRSATRRRPRRRRWALAG